MATSTIAPPRESGRGDLTRPEDFARFGRDTDGSFPDGPEAYREAALDGTLRRLFRGAIDQARSRIEWYDAKSKERATAAKRIRKWSLLLFALGTLSPILLTFLVKVAAVAGEGGKDPTKWGPVDWLAAVPLAEVGYVLLAVAGALVIFDQFFDASGSWIRYRQSQVRLEVLLADLRYAWAELMTTHGGTVNDRTQAAEFVALLRDFVTKVELLAEEETKEWARRFNERIATFDANPNLKVRLDSAPAGSTVVREPNIGTGNLRTRSGSASPRSAASARAATTSAPPSVKVRLAIDDPETLDSGSLQMTVNDAAVAAAADGSIELALEGGIPHRCVATGRRGGKPVRGELTVTPLLEDEGRVFRLQLA